MTTVEYDRTVKKLEHLRETEMSVDDYTAQMSLFAPDLTSEQMDLLKQLERKSSQHRNGGEQLGLALIA